MLPPKELKVVNKTARMEGIFSGCLKYNVCATTSLGQLTTSSDISQDSTMPMVLGWQDSRWDPQSPIFAWDLGVDLPGGQHGKLLTFSNGPLFKENYEKLTFAVVLLQEIKFHVYKTTQSTDNLHSRSSAKWSQEMRINHSCYKIFSQWENL